MLTKSISSASAYPLSVRVQVRALSVLKHDWVDEVEAARRRTMLQQREQPPATHEETER